MSTAIHAIGAPVCIGGHHGRVVEHTPTRDGQAVIVTYLVKGMGFATYTVEEGTA